MEKRGYLADDFEPDEGCEDEDIDGYHERVKHAFLLLTSCS
jgi:hypothetical protein